MPKIRTRNKRRHNRQNKTKRKQKTKQLVGGAEKGQLCINIKDLELYYYLRVSTSYPNCFTCVKAQADKKYAIPVRDIVFINGCCLNIMRSRKPEEVINIDTPKSKFTPSFIEHLKSIHHHCYTASQ